jgi:hypothetical protein
VTDEVDQIPSRPWQDFLKRFQHERINQHMVDGREVCADRHIIEIGIRLGRSERSINELFVATWERRAPVSEFLFEILELALR